MTIFGRLLERWHSISTTRPPPPYVIMLWTTAPIKLQKPFRWVILQGKVKHLAPGKTRCFNDKLSFCLAFNFLVLLDLFMEQRLARSRCFIVFFVFEHLFCSSAIHIL